MISVSRLSLIIAASFSVAPTFSWIFLVSLSYVSILSIKIPAVLTCLAPNASPILIAFHCSSFILFRTSISDELSSMPSIFAAFCDLNRAIFKPDPAISAFTPALARAPKSADVCSTLRPISFAVGATIFIDSPSIKTFVLLLDVVVINASLTLDSSLTFNPNAVKTSVVMSVASANATCPAVARLRVPGNAAILCLAVNPAAAKNFKAPAASVAVCSVVAPILRAIFSRSSSSFPVAPDQA